MMPQIKQWIIRKRLSTARIVTIIILLLLISGCALSDGSTPTDGSTLTDGSALSDGNLPTDSGSQVALIPDEQLQDARLGVREAIEKSIEEVRDANNPDGISYTVLNQNVPLFSTDEITTESFEEYSKLDGIGRCTVVFACLGTDLMPTEERGAIGQIKPSGWHTVKYDCVDGKYLYNRCHLIGYQLSGENANERNLITGTRYFNTEGMLPFENMVADYLNETKNHVLYRVTPYFDGENLLADGVEMEAWSVEDGGKGISFHVFVYNVQPGIEIDYETGESAEASQGKGQADSGSPDKPDSKDYVLNTNTKKFHLPGCTSVKQMKGKNRENYNGSREWLVENGYEPCKICIP